MRLTTFGFKGALFYLAMVGAFYASPYSNLFFLLLGFLTMQWVLCALWTRRNMRGVTAHIPALDAAPAGAGQTVRARVEASGRTRFQVSVELELADGERVAGQVDVVEGETQLLLNAPALPRGVYEVRSGRVASTYPLGLLAVRRPIDVPSEMIVYPAPLGLAEARDGGEALSEALGGRLSGAGDMQPSGLREHRDGDGLRAVHWRATARRGVLVVKEYEGGGGDGLEILIDRRCEPDALEEALSIVSAVVGLARTNKEVLALYSQGLHATYGEGHRPWDEALRFLAGANVLAADAAPPPPVSPTVTRLPQRAVHG